MAPFVRINKTADEILELSQNALAFDLVDNCGIFDFCVVCE